MIYANYPIDGVAKITERDIKLLGLPPTKAVEIDYKALSSPVSFASATSTIMDGRSYLIYDLPRYYRLDYYDIRGKVIPLYLSKPSPLPTQVNALMFYSFPFVGEGTYKVRFIYTLPGENKPHSNYVVNTFVKFNYYKNK